MCIQWAPIVYCMYVLLVFHWVTHPPVISHKCNHAHSLIQNAQTCKYLSLMLGYPNTSFCSVALLMFFHLNYMYSPIIKWLVYNSRPFPSIVFVSTNVYNHQYQEHLISTLTIFCKDPHIYVFTCVGTKYDIYCHIHLNFITIVFILSLFFLFLFLFAVLCHLFFNILEAHIYKCFY